MIHKGECHCGKIKIEIEAPEEIEVYNCNCSICTKKGYLHYIIPKNKFKLLSGEEFLSCYQFNTKIAKHLFCKECGCSPYYIPRSNPDGIDINIRCINQETFKKIIIKEFNGQNWESNAHLLTHLSK